MQVVKIETNTGRQRKHTQCALKGNYIHFPNDSPSVLSDVLQSDNMTSDICVHLAGSKGEYDQLYRHLMVTSSAHVMGQAFNLYTWYSVL